MSRPVSLFTRSRLLITILIPLTAAGLIWGLGSTSKGSRTAEKFSKKLFTAIERAEYETRMLQDPRTGVIPPDIRRRELAFAAKLPRQNSLFFKSSESIVPYTQDWTARGPFNVGGRTRALAVDLDYDGTTNRRIVAGGVSGGMYLSEDDGASWSLTTSLADMASVTTVAQDPLNRHVWYYGTGEWYGSSAAGGGNVTYLGHGIFKSTDGGRSWAQLESTILENNPSAGDSPFDIVWRIAVHPEDGSVFVAARATIFRSIDGGDSWEVLLRGASENSQAVVTDVAIAANGAVYAALGRNGGDHMHGVFVSTDGGSNWENITPPMLAEDTYRVVLAPAPSDSTTLYFLAQIDAAGDETGKHQLLRYDASSNTWSDLDLRSKLPPTAREGGFNSQGGYDLALAVKPDDPQTIWIGGTSLYRSTDGGMSFEHVGGYGDLTEGNVSTWENHWVDQHILTFLPTNPNVLLSGNDGGVSRADNALESPQTWTSLNNGYITSQFYSIAAAPDLAGNELLAGGFQDRGNWLLEDGEDGVASWFPLPVTGDGAAAAFSSGASALYFSIQHGVVYRLNVTGELAVVQPAGFEETDFLFVTPFTLDPNDSKVMYMAVGGGVMRNSDLSAIPNENMEPTEFNWSPVSGTVLEQATVTALAVSKEPADRLYFGALNFNNGTPSVVRKDDAAGDGPGMDITPPQMVLGSYVSNVSVNPTDGDELFVILSNYGVPSVFHSDDGGMSWTDVEGNLAGEDGPSVRAAAVIPTATGSIYLLATSTGIYGTTKLDGMNTTWEQQGDDVVGNVVVASMMVRPVDGFVAAGSHGRGAFTAYLDLSGNVARDGEAEVPSDFTLHQNYPNPFNPTTTIRYDLDRPSAVLLQILDVNGRLVDVLDEGLKGSGAHEVIWDGRNSAGQSVASGTYFYRLMLTGESGVPQGSRTRQMVLMR